MRYRFAEFFFKIIFAVKHLLISRFTSLNSFHGFERHISRSKTANLFAVYLYITEVKLESLAEKMAVFGSSFFCCIFGRLLGRFLLCCFHFFTFLFFLLIILLCGFFLGFVFCRNENFMKSLALKMQCDTK